MKYLILLLLMNLVTFAQKKDESPLLPLGATFQPDNLRLLLGVGQNVQVGEFQFNSVDDWCDCPPFRDGVGMGFTVAVHYEREIIDKLYWGAGIRFDNYSFESRFVDNQAHTAFPLDANSEADPIETIVSFYQIADLTINGIGLNPHLRWYPFDFLMFRLGVNASYIYSSEVTHSEELINNVTRDGKYVISVLDDPIIAEEEFPGINQFVTSLNFGIALPFLLQNDFTLAPGFEFSLPLSPISERFDTQIQTWRITFEVKIPISSTKFKQTKSNI